MDGKFVDLETKMAGTVHSIMSNISSRFDAMLKAGQQHAAQAQAAIIPLATQVARTAQRSDAVHQGLDQNPCINSQRDPFMAVLSTLILQLASSESSPAWLYAFQVVECAAGKALFVSTEAASMLVRLSHFWGKHEVKHSILSQNPKPAKLFFTKHAA